MASTKITNCRSCGSSALSSFLNLGQMPLVDRMPRPEQLADFEPRYPLEVVLCTDCALVQILDTVDHEELFVDDYQYYSSISDFLLRHSKDNVNALIESRSLDSSSFVVELASNDGYLLKNYLPHNISVLGIDPSPGPAAAAEARGVRTRAEFFHKKLAEELRSDGLQADVIHANNVLAHVPDLNDFVGGIEVLLKDDGVAVIETPYLGDLIEHCEFDTIYHEHHCYFSVTALSQLYERHGLYLNDVQPLSIHGGSLRQFVSHFPDPKDSIRKYLDSEAKLGMGGIEYFSGFSERVSMVKQQLQKLLSELKQDGATIGAYGAAAKGSILLNYVGIQNDMVDFVADRNVHKQGRVMPGVHIPIVDPVHIIQHPPDYLLILAWNFADEIIAQQDEYRRQGGKFIVPIPLPRVV